MIRWIFTVAMVALAPRVIGQQYCFKPDSSAVFNKSYGKQFLKQCTRETPKNIRGFFNIDSAELKTLENNFLKILLLPPAMLRNQNNLEYFKKYAFQFIGMVVHGRKYIYLNAFAVYNQQQWQDEFNYWRQDIVVWCDGGSDFFGVLFDIKVKTFSQFHFNWV